MATSERPAPADQAEVIAFLSDPASYRDARITRVDLIETHGAIVFLAGSGALKIKRSVKLAYLDFSTLARREAVCRREIEINRPNAPAIYQGVVAVTREADGSLAVDGGGKAVEWAVRMARFGQDALLSSIAAQKGIDDDLAAALAGMMLHAHHRAERRSLPDAEVHMRSIANGVERSFRDAECRIPDIGPLRERFVTRMSAQLRRCGPLLRGREAAGQVRRCHGDAHLGNIVLWDGAPLLFDAIEFDEVLATIDVLYDLAFLVMDLDRRGERRAAHIVLNRYLTGTGSKLDLKGLAALPLFLGLRAAIRAMVAFDRARVVADAARDETQRHGLETLERALAYLSPPQARLVAVGGFSGTGKTTLAHSLAPELLPAPGALHLRSDVLRKQLSGVGELERLPPHAYSAQASDAVYRALLERTRMALDAGHSVVVDAVFSQESWRSAFERIAGDLGLPFDGIWLEATGDLLKQRVAARTRDASDATPEVVERQIGTPTGTIGWHRLAASGDAAAVAKAAKAIIGRPTVP